MKIQVKNNRKITTFLILGILFLAALTGGSFYYMYHFQVGLFTPKKQSTSTEQQAPAIINYNPTTDQEKSAGNAIKDQTPPENTPTPTPPQGKVTVPLEITTASQNEAVVYVRSVIHTTTSQGSCTLTMKGPDDKVYSATATVQPLSSSSTCAGFNIQTSALSIGKWDIVINFNNNDATGTGRSSIEVK